MIKITPQQIRHATHILYCAPYPRKFCYLLRSWTWQVAIFLLQIKACQSETLGSKECGEFGVAGGGLASCHREGGRKPEERRVCWFSTCTCRIIHGCRFGINYVKAFIAISQIPKIYAQTTGWYESLEETTRKCIRNSKLELIMQLHV